MQTTRRTFFGAALAAAPALAQDGIPELCRAASSGDMARARALLKENPERVHERAPDGRTPMHFAAEGGHPEMVILMLGSGADLDAGPEPALLAAVNHPDATVAWEMTQTLAGNAANPNVRRAADRRTPLHLAAARGHAEVVWMLVHRGADVSARDAEGRTPLEAATGDAVRMLREADKIERVYFGARYRRNLKGEAIRREEATGLPQALIHRFVGGAHSNIEQTKQLLKENPSLLMARTTFDELAVEASAHVGLVPLAEHLLDAGAPLSLCTAVVVGLESAVREMVREDRNRLRERGAHDFALLQFTAWAKPQTAIAAFLLDSGVDVNSRGGGQTALHVAARRGLVELAELLVDRGARIDEPSRSRMFPGTPLDLAVKFKQEKMAEFLRSRGKG